MIPKESKLTVEQKKSLPIFFITSRPRSGTTMLRSLFDKHPNVIIPLESPFIIRYYWKYLKVTNWTKELILEFFEDVSNENQLGYLTINGWKMDMDQLKADLLALEGKTSYAELCKVVNASYPSFFAKQNVMMVGDKNPTYSNRTKYLMKLYPEAKFIHLVRDYRDYLQSMLKVGFVKSIEPIIVHRWKSSLKLNSSLQKKYPDRFFFMRYEDFVEQPQKHFKDMCNFLGIPNNHDEIFDFQDFREKAVEQYGQDIVDQFHSKLFKPINNANVGDWKKNLTEKQIMIAEAVTGKLGEKVGYKRHCKRIPFKIRLKVLPIFFYLYVTKHVGKILWYKSKNKNMRSMLERGPVLGKKYWNIVNHEKNN